MTTRNETHHIALEFANRAQGYRHEFQALPRLEIYLLCAVWLFALMVFVGSLVLLPAGGTDWRNDIGPGARHWYATPWKEGLVLPPYMALLLAPLGMLPDGFGTALINGASVILLSLVIRKFSGPSWVAIPVLVSPLGYWLFYNGQTDVLILSGLLLPGGWGIPLLVAKPQVAAFAVLPILRREGWRCLIPGAVVFGASLVIWPLWVLRLREIVPAETLVGGNWNSALWPYGIPVGLTALAWGTWRRSIKAGIVASPLLAPYVNLPSWLGLVGIVAARWPKPALVVWFGFWVSSIMILCM